MHMWRCAYGNNGSTWLKFCALMEMMQQGMAYTKLTKLANEKLLSFYFHTALCHCQECQQLNEQQKAIEDPLQLFLKMCLVPRIPPKNGCCFMFCTCTHSPKCHAFRSYTCRIKSMQNPTIIPSCSLVPIPMWAHYVAHAAIYTPSHKKYKRSHVQLT